MSSRGGTVRGLGHYISTTAAFSCRISPTASESCRRQRPRQPWSSLKSPEEAPRQSQGKGLGATAEKLIIRLSQKPRESRLPSRGQVQPTPSHHASISQKLCKKPFREHCRSQDSVPEKMISLRPSGLAGLSAQTNSSIVLCLLHSQLHTFQNNNRIKQSTLWNTAAPPKKRNRFNLLTESPTASLASAEKEGGGRETAI